MRGCRPQRRIGVIGEFARVDRRLGTGFWHRLILWKRMGDAREPHPQASPRAPAGRRAGARRRLNVAVDQILIEDATGTMAPCSSKSSAPTGSPCRWPCMYVDHNVLQIDDKNMQDHRYLQSFCAPLRHALLTARPRHLALRPPRALRPAGRAAARRGLAHRRWPGRVGMFATGAGGLEVAVAMAGYGFDFACPRVVGVELHRPARPLGRGQGRHPGAAAPPRRARRPGRGVRVLRRRRGHALDVTGRATICNMVVETGATAACSPPTRRPAAGWPRSSERTTSIRWPPTPAPPTTSVEPIDLSALEPLVARAAIAGQRRAGRRGGRHRAVARCASAPR